MKQTKTKSWRAKIHEVIYEADTPAGKFFDIALLLVILLSIALVIMETIPPLNERYYWEFYAAEWIITIIFTIEYVLRIIAIRRPSKYIFSFYGIVDLLSTIPTYLAFLGGGHNFLFAVRSLRFLRIFLILKNSSYVGESVKLKTALVISRTNILVFLFAVVVLCFILGTLMYLVEGPENGFTSIPTGIYWCIVTLTTVGFGDIHPVTPLGRFIASLIMITGYGIIAVPTGIVSAEYSKRMSEKQVHLNTQVCPHCNESRHLDNAKFCHNCGNSLND